MARSHGLQRGADLSYDLKISFEEAEFGCDKEVTIAKWKSATSPRAARSRSTMRTCQTCGGRGQVITSRGIFSIAQTCPRCEGAGRLIEKPCRACHGAGRRERTAPVKLRIPPGVDTGARLRSSGNGEAGARGGPAGDLYVVLHVQEHDIFQREGDDLLCEVPISYVQATLGAEIDVPTLTGKAQIKIPPGTQSGTIFRLRSKGVRNVHGNGIEICTCASWWKCPRTELRPARQVRQEFAVLCDANVN